MTNRHLLVWQKRISISLFAAATFSFLVGLNWPQDQSAKNKSLRLTLLPAQQLSLTPKTSRVKALIAQPDEAFQKVISRLAEQEKARRLDFSVPADFQGKMIRDVKLKGEHKVIALTFDDGPWPETTNKVLYVLKQHNVRATFFVVGKLVQKYPQLAKEVIEQGHAIGNHTWSHHYEHYNALTAATELDKTTEILKKTTGIETSLFRPPGGILNNGLAAYAYQKKYAVIMWSVDSRDWYSRRTKAQALVDQVLHTVQPGGIVLLHDGGGDRSKTVQALPQLITELKKHGYNFVTVPELLKMREKELKASKN
ncbi:polysaccharide deacetylase family protein [Lyngbya aestuarii]|uniref:polysaccharide deacetylase family protein n=1 Tax=Lyngbya aestuarii TaxID=118322 RepID=UPI00403D9349